MPAEPHGVVWPGVLVERDESVPEGELRLVPARGDACENCENPYDPIACRWRCPRCGWKNLCCG